MAEPFVRSVSVSGGLTLSVYDWEGPGEPVLLLHGLTGNARSLDGLAEALAGSFHVYSMDFCGRGGSGPGWRPLPGHAADALGVMDALDSRPFRLVGHSMGALVCLILAAEHPERVNRAVLIDAAGDVPLANLDAIRPALDRLEKIYDSPDAYRAALIQSPYLRPWTRIHETFWQADVQMLEDGRARSRVRAEGIRQELEANRAVRLDAYHGRVTVPVLILRAKDPVPGGPVLFGAEQAQTAHERIAGSRLVELKGYHHYSIVFNRHEAVDSLVRDFLKF